MTAQPSGSGQQLYYAGIAAVILVILLALWLLLKPAGVPESSAPVPVAEPVPRLVVAPEPIAVPEPDSEQEPVVSAEPELIVPEPAAEPEPEPLPELEQSDPLLKRELLQLDWPPGLAGLINTEQMVRNLVVTIDNLAQQQLVTNHPVVAPLDRPFQALAEPDGERYQLDPAGYQRYEPYLRLLETAEPEKMLKVLQRYQPLFEQAFAELGYPDLSFQQRLQQALQQFLAIEPIMVDTTLLRPSVAYTYADPAVESRSALQKQIIRMGPANHQRLRVVALRYQALLARAD
ncbi:hypothetical protein WG68_01765 [Arsukibacterium ikkense]|uniref:DUF3014 domain-containing protein n=1 Tax=Arsukibacterium ikkense TaxID=336831 RepID=A0A0M2V9U2_9GAMM|nr:DUF3014 domain-containing protein [Arsukibacterium ikkense]KKO47381.1 hypothetical protein WG68_01765 [Arsukibacterium ikkense]